MATDIERLVVQLSADVKKYENALNRALGVTNRQTRAMESRFDRMSKNVSASLANTLRNTTALVGGGLGVREIAQYADAWTEAGNKIRAAATSAGVQARSLEELNKGANDARTSLAGYADLYARLIRSAAGVAKSESEIAAATNAVSKAFKAGGASASEQAAGILQLGQALGSGVLQGDELRSLRENAPIVAQAIAKEFNATIAGLKQLGADGELTSDRVFKAILAAIPDIEKQFAATNKTIGDGFIQVKNNLTEYIGTMAEATGLTEAINTVLGALAGNITSVANAAAAAGVVLAATFGRGAALGAVAALANPFVALAAAVGAAAYAITQLWDNIVPLQGSLATLGDYAAALWQVLGDGAATVQQTVVDAFNTIVDGINGALSGVGTSISGLWEMVKSGVNSIIDAFARMADLIQAAFAAVPNAVGSAVVAAMNTMISGVEAGINKVIQAVNAAIRSINSLSGFAGIAPIGELSTQQLGRIEDSYAGAAKAAAGAWNDAINRETVDYLGMAGKGITDATTGAVDAIVSKANEVANARRELERETNRGGALTGLGENTAGFGGGIAGAGDGSGGKKKKGGGRSKQDEFAREIEQIKERTAALQAETAAMAGINPLIDDYGYALEKARAKQDLLTAAKKAGIAVTPELAAKIDELATGYANASAEADKLAESQDRAREMAEDFRELGKDVLGGFIKDLRDGKSASEALANALGKVADKLLDMALDSMFGGGGLFGGGGGLFGGAIIPGILHSGGVAGRDGYGHGRAVSPSVFAGAKRYHKGGVAGLMPGEVPAILQRGEVVIPKGTKAGATAGPQNLNINVNVDGANGDEHVISLVRQGVSAGLTQYDKQLNHTLSGKIANAQARTM
ncbi:tape measure protein [Pseudaminobacter sp. NGMCC 1.201702]|uniref:tape measure protein n=1 Tax=Pseudaminobacter sp. NGMCC 1.201702 TaxID=3391825 RepID=UPI0039EE090B